LAEAFKTVWSLVGTRTPTTVTIDNNDNGFGDDAMTKATKYFLNRTLVFNTILLEINLFYVEDTHTTKIFEIIDEILPTD